MRKKLLSVLVIGVVGSMVLSGTKASSLLRSQLWAWQEEAEDAIDPSAEIRRIRYEIAQMDKDIDQVNGERAQAVVNLREFTEKIDALRRETEQSERAVKAHGEVIKAASESDKLQWGSRQVAYPEAKSLLYDEVKRHNERKARLKVMEAGLASETRTAQLIEEHYLAMVDQQRELTLALKEVESEVRLAQVEQVKSKYQNDGTRSARIKTSLADLRKRALVSREKLRGKTGDVQPNPGVTQSVEEILAGLHQVGKSATGIDEVKVLVKP